MANNIEGMLYDNTSKLLANAISDAAEKQAIYAYNIANAATPGFKPLKFKKALEDANSKYTNEPDNGEFNIEDEMSKMSKNRLEHSAYTKILAARLQVAKKIATLGKGG
jgi:flagellar basal body rod protein FlgB